MDRRTFIKALPAVAAGAVAIRVATPEDGLYGESPAQTFTDHEGTVLTTELLQQACESIPHRLPRQTPISWRTIKAG